MVSSNSIKEQLRSYIHRFYRIPCLDDRTTPIRWGMFNFTPEMVCKGLWDYYHRVAGRYGVNYRHNKPPEYEMNVLLKHLNRYSLKAMFSVLKQHFDNPVNLGRNDEGTRHIFFNDVFLRDILVQNSVEKFMADTRKWTVFLYSSKVLEEELNDGELSEMFDNGELTFVTPLFEIPAGIDIYTRTFDECTLKIYYNGGLLV